jgi:hypothetical protein
MFQSFNMGILIAIFNKIANILEYEQNIYFIKDIKTVGENTYI